MNVRERSRLPVLGVDEALRVVLGEARPLAPQRMPLAEAAGRFLAETLHATADMPPFDRTAMDGFAVRAADVAGAPVLLEVIEEIPAGRDPSVAIGKGQAARIMTGAMIPPGADAVVMVEHSEETGAAGQVRILRASAAGLHIRRAGEDLKRGALLLSPGARLGAAAMALLAAEGRSQVLAGSLPSVAVLSTGDELVPIDETPDGSRIRETNSWSLGALLAAQGIRPEILGIARDEEGAIRERLAAGLRADVLLVSGGVSMGEFDLVGGCLEALGCRARFERVAIQPGKPLFFGTCDGASGHRTLVFGLPGNPVSSIVDFLVFARPALRRMSGDPAPLDPAPAARLLGAVRRHPGRRGYLPARLSLDGAGGLQAEPVSSMGSADLVALGRADAFLIAPEERAEISAGESLRVLTLPR
jgi:molybdopterin molybdotransferase